MLPGLILMLLLSWIYTEYGIKNAYFFASFQAIQPAVAAMVLRAVHKLGTMAMMMLFLQYMHEVRQSE